MDCPQSFLRPRALGNLFLILTIVGLSTLQTHSRIRAHSPSPTNWRHVASHTPACRVSVPKRPSNGFWKLTGACPSEVSPASLSSKNSPKQSSSYGIAVAQAPFRHGKGQRMSRRETRSITTALARPHLLAPINLRGFKHCPLSRSYSKSWGATGLACLGASYFIRVFEDSARRPMRLTDSRFDR
jgi:hypothetical protein